MLCPVDISLAPRPVPPDALRSIVAVDRAVFARRACNRNRKFRLHRSLTNAVSNFASTDATKVHLPLEQGELDAGSRDLPVRRLSPTPLSLRSLSEILDLPGPIHRSKYLPVASPMK